MSLNQELKRYEELKKRIKRSTPVPTNETAGSKQKRIDELLGSFDKFCKYYFPIFLTPTMVVQNLAGFIRKLLKKLFLIKTFLQSWNGHENTPNRFLQIFSCHYT